MADLDIPIALRRPRRSNAGDVKDEYAAAALPAPKTPRRAKKAVRFSDPGPSLSSGLTPMIRHTSLHTPRRRRASTPARSVRSCTPAPQQKPLFYSHDDRTTYHPLHQTIDGRVERRIRRNNLRDLINKLEDEKKRKSQVAQAEISHLKSEIKSRDREIYELQNATIVIDTDRIWDLEQQIDDLKEELSKRPETPHNHTRSYDWTMAARDPFADDFMDMTGDDDQFGNATMAQLDTGTPSRARSSFPTPPATSPVAPNTPCSMHFAPTPRSHTGVQVSLQDPAKQQLEEELASLQLEVCKLTTTLDSYKNLRSRLVERLASVEPLERHDEQASSTDLLEQKVAALLQNMSDRTAAVAHLTSAISDLGFPGSDSSEMITTLASGFRAARLELEYLTPGEITLPLTSHGAEVLDLLLTRLRELATKAKEDESAIDEYHEIEQSLRKQLDARVTVMDGLKAEMGKAERLMNEKNIKIKELQIGNDRLKGAVDGYIRDMSELEKLVERMEQESRDAQAARSAQKESERQELDNKTNSIAELEEKLADALRQTTNLQKEINDVQDSTTAHVVSMNKRHGNALALRDARVLELRGEIDRVNASLRDAHETIRVLRVQNGGLKTQMDREKAKAKAAMDSMKAELQRVLYMSQEFLDSPKRGKTQKIDDDRQQPSPHGQDQDQSEDELASSPGGCAADVTGRRSGDGCYEEGAGGKKRRRYDSGIALLEEDEVDTF